MMDFHTLNFFTIFLLFVFGKSIVVDGLACNWGLQASHPLPPDIVVKLLKDNGFDKVKLFEADPNALEALGKSGIQVMVGIPNDMLAGIASSVQIAERWVEKNVSYYLSNRGVDIRYTNAHCYSLCFIQDVFIFFKPSHLKCIILNVYIYVDPIIFLHLKNADT